MKFSSTTSTVIWLETLGDEFTRRTIHVRGLSYKYQKSARYDTINVIKRAASCAKMKQRRLQLENFRVNLEFEITKALRLLDTKFLYRMIV